MNRKKKINQTLKSKLKKANLKLQNSNKPKYLSKAVRAQIELDEIALSNIIETKRLTLGALTSTDAQMMLTLFNEPDVLTFVGDKNIRSITDAEFIINAEKNKQSEFGFSFYCVRLSACNTPIGVCGLIKCADSQYEEFGFSILNEYKRQGYTKEASIAVIEYAKSSLELQQLYAKTSKNNTVSQHLLLSLDFELLEDQSLDNELNHYLLTFK